MLYGECGYTSNIYFGVYFDTLTSLTYAYYRLWPRSSALMILPGAKFELNMDDQSHRKKVASMRPHALPSVGDLKLYMGAESFYDV